ncbi:unannotated protein [freshwater metagenome]|uniref:Unannotated protein n=1 Tax=freshwater metagenome TaxID=449393 RepID=A0A6J7PVS8_9ZZZZ
MRRGFVCQWSNYRAFSDLAEDGLNNLNPPDARDGDQSSCPLALDRLPS